MVISNKHRKFTWLVDMEHNSSDGDDAGDASLSSGGMPGLDCQSDSGDDTTSSEEKSDYIL